MIFFLDGKMKRVCEFTFKSNLHTTYRYKTDELAYLFYLSGRELFNIHIFYLHCLIYISFRNYMYTNVSLWRPNDFIVCELLSFVVFFSLHMQKKVVLIAKFYY